MAVIKHIASKNADYGESERYLIFQHNEYTQKPILDDEGHMILRDEYYLDGLNCDPFTFASECQELNSYYHKNKNFNEIKSHHYIISFDPKDREECGLTGERAQQLGLTFAKKNFPGHQALVCTHTDGHNESGNIHVHIVINSLRKYDVPQEPHMEFDCESKAGYKHHLSTACLAHLKQDVMDMCQKEGLHQVDLLSPAERKITEKEYWAQRRGQEKLDKLNQKMFEDGITPKKTRYQTEKQFLRDAIDDAASTAKSPEEFAKILDENIISSSKSAATDTAIFIQAEKNISLDEISEHDMKRIFYYRHLRKMQNRSLIGKWKLKNRKFQILQKICKRHFLLMLPIFLHRSFS